MAAPCSARSPRHHAAGTKLYHAIQRTLSGLPLLTALAGLAPAATAAAANGTNTDPQATTTTLAGVNVTMPIAKDSDSVTRTNTPIVEIPQSVTVITDQQMQARGIQGVEEAVWYTAGAQGGGYGPDARSDWLLVRGFTPARYLDGLALPEGSGTGITRIEPWWPA